MRARLLLCQRSICQTYRPDDRCDRSNLHRSLHLGWMVVCRITVYLLLDRLYLFPLSATAGRSTGGIDRSKEASEPIPALAARDGLWWDISRISNTDAPYRLSPRLSAVP